MTENLLEFKNMAKTALDAMEEHANQIGASGVAVFLYANGSQEEDHYSVMRIIGAFHTIAEDQTGYNFIALAYSKIAESIETGLDSGNLRRPLITGEFGYQGSAAKKVKDGLVITSFSGCTGEIDLEIARSGINTLKGTL